MSIRLALGGLAAATTASLGVTVAGMVGAQLPLVDVPLGSPAAAAELAAFEDCDELLRWYVDQALPQVGPYGLGGWGGPVPLDAPGLPGSTPQDLPLDLRGPAPLTAFEGAPTRAVAGRGPVEGSVSGSDTGTNVQEVGVDEPDRAKTDGEVVVHVAGRRLVVTDVSSGSAEPAGEVALPADLGNPELLLVDGGVLVLGTEVEPWRGPVPGPVWSVPQPDVQPAPDEPFLGLPEVDEPEAGVALPEARVAVAPFPVAPERSRVLTVSLADPAHPEVVADRSFGASLLSARQHGDIVRLVLASTTPALDFVTPNRNRTEQEATEANRRVVEQSGIEDWLPTVRSDGSDPAPVVDCAEVRHPQHDAGLGTVAVVSLATDGAVVDGVAVTARTQAVYSSADRLYLALPDGRHTDVHAFALDGAATTYLASGRVPGTVADRWSMDEHDGVLRLAVAHGPGWSPDENGVTTLVADGPRLRVAGVVRGLGKGEEIKAVRWFDDLAVLVTFRQTDPLYTVDLSDPARPRSLGELHLPGFSSYLHPLGDDRLLGLGSAARRDGTVTGGQAETFDIADLGRPRLVDRIALGRRFPATDQDPRAFTWIAAGSGSGTAYVAVSSWSGPARVQELVVGVDGVLEERRSWPLPRGQAYDGRVLPLPGGVAVVGDTVEVVPS